MAGYFIIFDSVNISFWMFVVNEISPRPSRLYYRWHCFCYFLRPDNVHNWLTFWHRSFTFNSNKSPNWCNSFSVYYPDVSLQLNMFPAFSRPSSGAQWLQWQPLVLPSYRVDSRAVFVIGPARPRLTALLSPSFDGKPEAATAVVAPDDGHEDARNMLSCI